LIVKRLDADVGGKTFVHRRDVNDQVGCVRAARRSPEKLLRLVGVLGPFGGNSPGHSLRVPFRCLAASQGGSLGSSRRGLLGGDVVTETRGSFSRRVR